MLYTYLKTLNEVLNIKKLIPILLYLVYLQIYLLNSFISITCRYLIEERHAGSPR